MVDGKSPVTKGNFHILNWGFICKTHNSMAVIGNSPVWKFHTIQPRTVSVQMHRRGNQGCKYRSVLSEKVMTVFVTCAIFREGPGGRIKWARGPHTAPGPHVGQPCMSDSLLYNITGAARPSCIPPKIIIVSICMTELLAVSVCNKCKFVSIFD